MSQECLATSEPDVREYILCEFYHRQSQSTVKKSTSMVVWGSVRGGLEHLLRRYKCSMS